MQRAGIASNRSRVAVVLVIFALLAFTTIRTSPLSTGLEPGSSLSKTTPKQRHLSVQEIVWAIPVLSSVAIVRFDYGEVVPAEISDFSCDFFSGRYFNLPPPTA